MKTKCPKCGTGKARRRCAREGNAEICSEIDSKYQPAISNRKLAEQMEEGRPLENTVFKSVNHSLENFMNKRK